MPFVSANEVAPLVTKARLRLGMSQQQLGEMLGASRRTVIRWNTGSKPTVTQVVTLAKAVYAKDPALASALAVAAGTRLAELGLGVPVAKEPSVPVKELAVHSIVCVAAEASETTPQATRAGLLAALERAEKLGVTSEELTEALRKGEGAGG
ncbi:MAG: helix-turn-helix transcriptional regulator [Polyangiaceae bacterium]